MSIEPSLTDQALLQLIGERLARLRLAKNLTQQQLAEQAGLGVRTVQRLELGEAATQLSGFVRVCRVLGIVERFEALFQRGNLRNQSRPSAEAPTSLSGKVNHVAPTQ